jgi:MFS family permease
MVNTYGVFQSYYTATAKIGSVSAVTWIGSVQAFLLLVVAPVVGRMCDAGHAQHVVRIGTALISIGLFVCSFFGNNYVATLLLQGVLTGIGLGCLFTPAMAVLPPYFVRLRAFALGVAAAGAGFGGVLYPIIVRIILDRYGYGWAMRTLMFLALTTQIIPCILTKRKSGIPTRALDLRILEFSHLSDRRFAAYCAGLFLVFLGLYVPYFFIVSWITDTDLDMGFKSYYILSIMNAGGILGRMIPSILADVL